MAVQLFEHKQRAFLSVEVMLDDVGKDAVVHLARNGKELYRLQAHRSASR